MKTIEQKAKAYDNLLVRLQEAKVDNDVCDDRYCYVIDEIVPELKESEDERIRKVLVDYFKRYKEQEECGIKTFFGIPTDNIIAWLEKQGEQKITDKYNIRGIKSKHAEGKLGEMIKNLKSADKVEPKFHVDDIISNGISEVKIVSIESNYYNVTNYEIENDAHICNWVVYFKDQDNWKLKDKVQPQSKKGEQKVADKKESLTDVEKSILNFADYFHSNRCKPESEWVDEIKMLRDYIPSRILKLATWSKEDEKIYQSIIDDTVQENQLDIKQIDWLKSIKDRVQPKVEWGEEDERLFQIVIDILDRQNHLGNISRTDLIACVRKLKSLRPQKQWKPSELQIEALESATANCAYSEYVDCLKELQEQLKQL